MVLQDLSPQIGAIASKTVLQLPEPSLQGHKVDPALEGGLASVLTSVCLGFRLSTKSLLTSDDYELGAGIRKRHKGPEEEHDTLIGMGKARGRNHSWDEQEASSDFMSQVSSPGFQLCCDPGVRGPEVMLERVHVPFAGLLGPVAVRNG